jgi:hypothetical protein
MKRLQILQILQGATSPAIKEFPKSLFSIFEGGYQIFTYFMKQFSAGFVNPFKWLFGAFGNSFVKALIVFSQLLPLLPPKRSQSSILEVLRAHFLAPKTKNQIDNFHAAGRCRPPASLE